MLIGFRPSQPPAAAPLCRGFRAAVPGPVPPSAVRPSRRAPQGPFRVTKVHMSVNKGEVGFYRDARFRVLGLGFSVLHPCLLFDALDTGRGMCVAMLIGFRPSRAAGRGTPVPRL